MYTQVAEKWLAEQASLTPLQREFLEKALAFYERFAAEEGSDPQVRHEAIRALYRVGLIRERLGRHAEAEAAFRQVVALVTDLVRPVPRSARFRPRAGRGLGSTWRPCYGRPAEASDGTRGVGTTSAAGAANRRVRLPVA